MTKALSIGSQTRSLRARLGSRSLLVFCQLYLRHRFGLSWSRMHEELNADLVRPTVGSPLRLVVGAPDGYGKSTLVSHAFVLWTLAFKRHRCIVIGSGSRRAAGEHLAGVDSELRSNERLLRDFPHLRQIARTSGASGSRASPPRRIEVPGIAMVQSVGPTSHMTSMNFEGTRPELFILDEFEQLGRGGDGEAGRRTEQTMKERILHRFTDASVVVLGPLHENGCLVDRLLDPARSRGWTQRFYKAVESYPAEFDLWFRWAARWQKSEQLAQRFLDRHRQALLAGSRVLWPQHESFARLMHLRAEHGWEWFDRYRQGLPPEGSRRAGSRSSPVFGGDQYRLEFSAVDDAGYRRMLGEPHDRRGAEFEFNFGDTDRHLPRAAARAGRF